MHVVPLVDLTDYQWLLLPRFVRACCSVRQILRFEAVREMSSLAMSAGMFRIQSDYFRLLIRREHILEDALQNVCGVVRACVSCRGCLTGVRWPAPLHADREPGTEGRAEEAADGTHPVDVCGSEVFCALTGWPWF